MKYLKYVFPLIVIIWFITLPVYSSEIPSVNEYITDEIWNALPESQKELLNKDDGYTGPSINESIDFFIETLNRMIEPVLDTFFNIIGVILLCSCFYMLAGLSENTTPTKIYRFLASLCLAIMIFNVLSGLWDELDLLLGRLNSLMNAITVSTTSIYALSGAVTTAAVNESQMMIVLTIVEDITYYATYPILQICFGMSFIGCITESIDLSAIGSLIRRTFTTALIILMSIVTAVLSFQNTLGESSDTLLIRTIKLASGSFVPIVGNAVSEATRTVAAGLDSLKNTLGIISIIALISTVLPLMITLWLNKFSFSIGSAFSEVLGLDRESRFLKGSSELIDFAIAIIAAISLVFIINLMIFVRSDVIYGG